MSILITTHLWMHLRTYSGIDIMRRRGFDFGEFEITKREILASTCITHVPNVSEFPLYFFVGLKRLINPLNVEDVKVPVSSNLNPLFIQIP